MTEAVPDARRTVLASLILYGAVLFLQQPSGAAETVFVETSGGDAVKDAMVFALPHTGWRSFFHWAEEHRTPEVTGIAPHRTAADGQAVLRSPKTTASVFAVHEQGYGIELLEEDQPAVLIRLHPWAKIEGQMFIDGKPAPPGQRVLLEGLIRPDPDGPGIHFHDSRRTERDGRFSFAHVPQGRVALHRIVVGDRGVWHRDGILMTVGGDAEHKVKMGVEGREIHGRVEIPQELQVVEACLTRISALEDDDLEKLVYAMQYDLTVTPDGAFRAAPVPPGHYHLLVEVQPLNGDPSDWLVGIVTVDVAEEGAQVQDLGLVDLEWSWRDDWDN